jgi:hypothetical protein
MSELQYPFVNIPPIVYNQPLATMNTPDTMEAYNNNNQPSIYNTPQNSVETLISFVPNNGNGELSAVQGIALHPQRHILTNNTFMSSRRATPAVRSTDSDTKNKKKKTQPPPPPPPPPPSNPEMAKYYVAGLSVVGLVILYRFMSRTQY